ncbi:hypothetical protein ACWGQ2_04085 [Arthrobacter sp. NPDC055585]
MMNSTHLIEHADVWLSEAMSSPDGPVLLSSPYLTYEVCRQLSAAARRSLQPFVLLTKLDPSAVANGFLSVQGLKLLLDAEVEIRHSGRLHAKCFILGSRAMIGSANLTGAGLGSSANPNRELGISLTIEQADAARLLIEAWPANVVAPADLEDVLSKANALGHAGRTQDNRLDADSALQLAEQLLIDARDPQRSLWLKLEYGEPALDGWREETWFASPKKGRPGFRPGDLVFICAKDTRDCYAVVEVAGEPEYQPEYYADWTAANDVDALARWPWINTTKPRLVPHVLMELKLGELGVSGQALQNGHVRLKLDQFSAGVRALARLATA